jgi:E3 SUMO-protein ligase PIAS1
MSTEAGGQAVVRAQPVSLHQGQILSPASFMFYCVLYEELYLTIAQFLSFPCGIVRGALAALDIVATVQAEINELPGAVFQIKTIPVKS